MEDHLATRARALREAGFTPLRTVRRLRREFPHVERDVLWALADTTHRPAPLWTQLGSCIHPVVCRFDRRPDTPPLMPLAALEERA